MECQDCGEQADELTRVKVGRRVYKLCEDCAQKRQENSEIAGEAESAMRDMMEYKGKK